MEQQRIRMEAELEKYYGKEDWSMAFRAGPESISILAECILITSGLNVIGIEIDGPGLLYTTLSANIIHCAVVGNDTFRETARNMDLLAELTHELSQPDGTIDKMLKFSEPGQSKDRDELLAEIIAEGEESVTDCMDAIEKVSKSFDGWCNLTKALHLALEDTRVHKQREKLNAKSEIEKHQMDKELKEEQRKKEELKMQEKQEEMQKTREKKEWHDNNVDRIFTRGGLTATVAAGVLAFAHYVTLRAGLSSMEEAQAKRDQEIRELEESKASLEETLAHLSKDSKSIDEVLKIVKESIGKVMELQRLIRNLMNFLRDMNKIISYTVKHSKRTYNGFKKKDSFVDSEIKKQRMKTAFDMKTIFIFASKASNVYNAVSSQYILPTLDILSALGHLDETADHEMREKIDELHMLRCKVASDVDCLSRKMHKELKESMVDVTRDSARVFEELLPED